MNPLNEFDPIMLGVTAAAVLAGVAILTVIVRLVRRAIRSGAGTSIGFGIAVVIAAGVAVAGGVKSFNAVAHQFGSPLVPLVADGMVIACTALRLAAMTKGWRIPGAALTTYVFIAGSVIINTTAVDGWALKLGFALAPLAYAVLAEMLAHLVRLQMKLSEPVSTSRIPPVKWLVSPVVTWRMWVHMKRTDATDPRAARTLIKQVERTASRLAAVCPSRPTWLPFGPAHAARAVALDAILEGLLTRAEVSALLPADDSRLSPAELLARIDRATNPQPAPADDTAEPVGGPARLATAALAVHRPAAVTASAPVHRHGPAAGSAAAPGSTAPAAPAAADASASTRPSASASTRTGESASTHTECASAVSAPTDAAPSAPADGDDAELVAFLRRYAAEHNGGQPLAIREVQRLLSSGWSKAKRIHALTDWPDAEPVADQHVQSRQLHLIANSSHRIASDDQTESQESRA